MLGFLTANSTKGLAFVGWHAGDGDSEPAVIVISFRGTLSRYFENWWSDLSSLKLSATPYAQSTSAELVMASSVLQTHFCGLTDAILEINRLQFRRRAHPSKNHWPLAWRRPGVGLCCTSLQKGVHLD